MKFISQIEADMKNNEQGPDEPLIPWDENHDAETLAMLNLSDTCKFISADMRKQLRERKL